MVAFLIVILLAGGCGGGGDAGPSPDGEELFNTKVLEGQAGCVTCHSRQPDVVLTGPSLAAIGVDAGSRVPGTGAAEYIERSIVDPDVLVVDGFEPGQMPKVWGEVLDDEQVAALVDYLLTLRG